MRIYLMMATKVCFVSMLAPTYLVARQENLLTKLQHEEFEKLAEYFTKPTKEEVLSAPFTLRPYRENPFHRTLLYLEGSLGSTGSWMRKTAKESLYSFFEVVGLRIKNERNMSVQSIFSPSQP